MAAIHVRRNAPMRNLFPVASIEERNHAEYLAWQPTWEAWKREHGDAFLTSYEAYCKAHDVDPGS